MSDCATQRVGCLFFPASSHCCNALPSPSAWSESADWRLGQQMVNYWICSAAWRQKHSLMRSRHQRVQFWHDPAWLLSGNGLHDHPEWSGHYAQWSVNCWLSAVLTEPEPTGPVLFGCCPACWHCDYGSQYRDCLNPR